MQKILISLIKYILTSLLANGSITSQNISILNNGQIRWLISTDLQCASPLGKVSTGTLVLLASLIESIETLSGSLTVSAGQRHCTLVDLDARDDAGFVEDLDKRHSGVSLLEERLFVEDHTRDVIVQVLSRVRCEEQLTVESAVLFVVLDFDRGETLSDRSGAFVSGQ